MRLFHCWTYLQLATQKAERCNAALLYAIVSGKVDTVKALAKHMEINIEDVSGRPLLHYVYLLDQQEVRRKLLDIVIPKLEPSFINICTTAKHGDLESTKYIAEKLQPSDRYLTDIAGKIAIQNGHDDIAKWMVETPDIMDWETRAGSLIGAAVERNNIDMVKYFSKRSSGFPLHRLGYGVASNLWALLRRVNCTELFRKFVPSHPNGYSLLFKK